MAARASTSPSTRVAVTQTGSPDCADRAASRGPLPDDPANGTLWPGDHATDNENNPHLVWIHVHLHHLARNAQTISEPALRVAEARRRPWWR